MHGAPPVSPLVQALEVAWAAIRRAHPDVPAAILRIGAGDDTTQPAGCITLGVWSASRWASSDDGEVHHEVTITGEAFEHGAAAVWEVLLHEAAHGLAHKRKIQDTSSLGRYHNKRFVRLANELGLEAEQIMISKGGRTFKDPRGFQTTKMRAATLRTWQPEIEALAAAHKAVGTVHRLVRRPHPAPAPPRAPRPVDLDGEDLDGEDLDGEDGEGLDGGEGETPARPVRSRIVLECGCKPTRPIEVARGTAARGGFACLVCGCEMWERGKQP